MVKSTLYPALAVISTLLLGSLVLRLGPMERIAKLTYECGRYKSMMRQAKVKYEGEPSLNKKRRIKLTNNQIEKIHRLNNLPWKLKTGGDFINAMAICEHNYLYRKE